MTWRAISATALAAAAYRPEAPPPPTDPEDAAHRILLAVRRCRLTVSKPELKAHTVSGPETVCDKLLESFAFKFNLRRYIAEDRFQSGLQAIKDVKQEGLCGARFHLFILL